MNNEHHETIPRPMSSNEVKAYTYVVIRWISNLPLSFLLLHFLCPQRGSDNLHIIKLPLPTYITNLHMFVFLLVTDGLIDCQDPECCEAAVCKSSQLCATVARPVDILLQRQPPASTASFFQKMRFIIEEGSLQRYAKNTAFNER
jgi:hypothetical protein